jgi:hypothetical protein
MEENTGVLNNTNEIWSDDYIVSRLKEHLAHVANSESKVKTDLLDNGKILDSRKYYNQCYHYLKLGACDPATVQCYFISISDLSYDLIKNLASLDFQDRKFVLKQSVGRLFEDIDSALYHGSISRVLQVKLID